MAMGLPAASCGIFINSGLSISQPLTAKSLPSRRG
jgi:hypothetical protein